LKQEVATVRTESFYLGVKLRDGVGRLNDAVLRSQLSRSDALVRESFFEQSHQLKELIARTAPHLTTDAQRKVVGHFDGAFAAYLTNMTALIERARRAGAAGLGQPGVCRDR